MTKTIVIAIAVVALAAGIAIGRFALKAPTPAATSAAETTPKQDGAAEAASRAMTFTQPKAPTR
ncbi:MULTISPECIES: hypothetical protein [Hyphomicrobiales]|uniref:hypothetical protein n=1 Tax=Hyphomicrobiales TaxID=356 RepID=UPI0003DF25E8|nr:MULTISPECIES: hypothetical protein [Hyphomicrobiales]CAH1662857.1 conserved hypothetical protein [Hyphomicrobiales bacterium]ETR79431.1 hypothetical protein X566_00505 [Afipia sp. P52-10]MBS7743606.1 hypothetical protein [Chelatococcus sp. HY11]MBX3546491.1 hypothetical protein [Chelatococcus sp.]MCO5079792.1 hypothetical protein [Chelatococcus sp.]